MPNTKVPIELSSTPGIIDNSTVTAITIDSAGAAAFSGTVTATGLTVAGGGSLTFSELTSKIIGPLNQDFIIQQRGNADTEALRIQNLDNNNLAKFDKNGDISFYDDAGAAKLFWDASAESLDIGLQSTAITGLRGARRLVLNDADQGVDFVAYASTNGIVADQYIGGYLFGNDDNNVTEDHFAGMWANSEGTGGSMTLRFAAGKANYETDTPQMMIDGVGNVGIGTSTITNPYGQTPFTDLNIEGTWGGAISFKMGGVTKGWVGQRSSGNEDMVIGAAAGQELLFYENAVEAARISSGNLLLGTTAQILSGKQTIEFSGLTHNGLVLKTTYAPLGSYFTVFANSNGAVCGGIIQNGTTSVNFSASSDRRLKENIADSDDSGSVIDAIQVRKFDWIGTDEHERFGFIAQELQEVVPIAVCSMGMAGEKDSMLGVDPSKLMALAIKEIQSLRARIAILEGA